LPEVLVWLSASLIAADLSKEAGRCTTRISQLVGAVKNYTYLDQVPLQEVDANAALESTLTVLSFDLCDVELTRELVVLKTRKVR